jgi:hypothetical protein
MRNNVKMLLAAGLIAATTAACTAETGYPGTYGYPSTAYNSTPYNNGGYYQNGGNYSNRPAYSSSYYAAPATPRRGPNGDYDRDGIPNKYDRDANGDSVPDRYQR